MEGNEEYEFIHTIRRLLDDSANAVIEEIVLTGKSKAEKKSNVLRNKDLSVSERK